jgi:hypothetical protein
LDERGWGVIKALQRFDEEAGPINAAPQQEFATGGSPSLRRNAGTGEMDDGVQAFKAAVWFE